MQGPIYLEIFDTDWNVLISIMHPHFGGSKALMRGTKWTLSLQTNLRQDKRRHTRTSGWMRKQLWGKLKIALAAFDGKGQRVPLAADKPELGWETAERAGPVVGCESRFGKDFGGSTAAYDGRDWRVPFLYRQIEMGQEIAGTLGLAVGAEAV